MSYLAGSCKTRKKTKTIIVLYFIKSNHNFGPNNYHAAKVTKVIQSVVPNHCKIYQELNEVCLHN